MSSSEDESGSCITEVASSPVFATSSPSPSPLRRRKRDQAEVPRTLRRRLYSEENSDDNENWDQQITYSPGEEQNEDEHLDQPTINIPAEGQHEDEDLSESDGSVNIDSSDGSLTSLSYKSSDEVADSEVEVADSEAEADCNLAAEVETVEDNENGNGSLFNGSPKSTNQAILDILKVFVKERWSKTSLDANVKLIKGLLPEPNDLPNSGKALLKHVERLTSLSNETECFYCSECKKLRTGIEETCPCGLKMGSFFAFPIEGQVRHLFENRNLALLIDQYKDTVSKQDFICDIRDGIVYKDVKKHLTGQYDTVFLWNTDGVSLSKSSKQQLWVILSTICEIPLKLRSSFVLVSDIYVGTSKPDMNIFLQPFVNSLKAIFIKGGIEWTHPVDKKKYTSMVVAPGMSDDAPATAISLKVLQYNSKYGCNVCEQKAQRVQIIIGILGQGGRIKHKRCFVFQEESAKIRSGFRMDRQGKLVEARGRPLKGVIGEAIVSDIPLADRALCVCAEYLHTVLLGVCKYILNLLFFERGPWYIGDRHREIDSFMFNEIKVPDYMKRLPRAIVSNFKLMKGN